MMEPGPLTEVKGKFRVGISDGGKAIKFRCFVSKNNSKDFPNLNSLIEELEIKGYAWLY